MTNLFIHPVVDPIGNIEEALPTYRPFFYNIVHYKLKTVLYTIVF